MLYWYSWGLSREIHLEIYRVPFCTLRNSSSNHTDAATYIEMYTDMYTGPENMYLVLEISISNITRYCLINFHYVYRVCMPNVVIQQVRCI